MDPITENELMEVLRKKYPDAEAQLFRNPRTGNLGGTIVSERFAGMEGPHRQQAVWPLIREAFADSAARLGVLSLKTQEEQTRSLEGRIEEASAA